MQKERHYIRKQSPILPDFLNCLLQNSWIQEGTKNKIAEDSDSENNVFENL